MRDHNTAKNKVVLLDLGELERLKLDEKLRKSQEKCEELEETVTRLLEEKKLSDDRRKRAEERFEKIAAENSKSSYEFHKLVSKLNETIKELKDKNLEIEIIEREVKDLRQGKLENEKTIQELRLKILESYKVALSAHVYKKSRLENLSPNSKGSPDSKGKEDDDDGDRNSYQSWARGEDDEAHNTVKDVHGSRSGCSSPKPESKGCKKLPGSAPNKRIKTTASRQDEHGVAEPITQHDSQIIQKPLTPDAGIRKTTHVVVVGEDADNETIMKAYKRRKTSTTHVENQQNIPRRGQTSNHPAVTKKTIQSIGKQLPHATEIENLSPSSKDSPHSKGKKDDDDDDDEDDDKGDRNSHQSWAREEDDEAHNTVKAFHGSKSGCNSPKPESKGCKILHGSGINVKGQRIKTTASRQDEHGVAEPITQRDSQIIQKPLTTDAEIRKTTHVVVVGEDADNETIMKAYKRRKTSRTHVENQQIITGRGETSNHLAATKQTSQSIGKKPLATEVEPVVYPTLKSRNSPGNLVSAFKAMNNAQRNDIKEMGFGRLLELEVTELPTTLSYWLLENFDPKRCEIKLQGGRGLHVEAEDVSMVLGLPNGPHTIQRKANDRTNELVDEWRGFYSSGTKLITSKKVMKTMLKHETGGVWFKRLFLILMTTCLIGGRGNGYVSTEIIGCLEDITKVHELDWGEYVIRCLVEKTENWQKNKENTYSGPILFLLLLYVDRVVLYRRLVPRAYPSLIGWTCTHLRSREKQEIKSGGFGFGYPSKRYKLAYSESKRHTGENQHASTELVVQQELGDFLSVETSL
ncbi:hypothetical protein CASFOL_010909 [Castilleja foliolosa]|uniref:Aminotransferase-like plant mobile domain-containing protein n=1 Tax=Castilleja foliolosa TaxID=1961234 RepID=A0ABD3DY19_9LAMI